MRYAVVYSSKTGNTALLARRIQSVLSAQDCVFFGQPGDALPEAELYLVGFWTDKGDCDPAIAQLLSLLGGKHVFLFGTAGFGGSPDYFERILLRVRAHLAQDALLTGSFMCQGKMPPSVRERYEAQLAAHPEDKRFKMLVENFDAALAHPDDADLLRLDATLRGISLKAKGGSLCQKS